MPTLPTATNRYANMSAMQVLAAQVELLARYSREDAERQERNARILAALESA